MKYDVISADCHIDLIWLPPDLFTANASAALRDRMPYVTNGERGKEWVTKSGASFGLMNGMGSAGRLYEPCYATYQSDPIGVKVLDELGEDNIMWGSDFPHPDGVWPDSQEYIQRELGHLPATTRKKIVCDNAAKLYRFVN